MVDRPDHLALRPLFRPRGIAVVGASADPAKAGNAMMRALAGFPGRLVPVNRHGGEIEGRTAYPAVDAAPGPIDLAVLVLPAAATPAALEDCAAAGVRAAVVCAGGFGESGAEGARLQRAVRDTARRNGIRLLGPNTSGFVNPADRVCACFLPAVADLPAGGIGIVARSGGVNLALAFLLAGEGGGLRLALGLGNAVDVDAAEVVEYLADDPGTRVIALHVEGVADGRRLYEAVRRTVPRKPVVAITVGRSDVGDFARSHTGSLTGRFVLTRAALAQAGAVVVDELTELADACRTFELVRAAPSPDPGIGVVTGQAGPGLLIADALRSRGAAVPEFASATRERLGGLLPPITYQRNPVDTGRPSPAFAEVLAAVAGDPAVDALLVYALDEPEALDPAAAVRAVPDVPVVYGGGGPAAVMADRQRDLAAARTPLFRSPDRVAHAAWALAADGRATYRLTRAERLIGPDSAPDAGVHEDIAEGIDEDGAKTILERAGLRAPVRRVCASRAEAHRAFVELRGPVVVKACHPALRHKTDVGGVHVGITDASGLDRALDAIDALNSTHDVRYLIEEQAGPGAELIVGGVRDAAFGPTVLLGMGGVAVELTADPILRLAPLTGADAAEMVEALPGAVLAGFRGEAPIDRAAVAAVLRAVSDTLVRHPEIAELDINPLRLTAEGPLVLDALIEAGKEPT